MSAQTATYNSPHINIQKMQWYKYWITVVWIFVSLSYIMTLQIASRLPFFILGDVVPWFFMHLPPTDYNELLLDCWHHLHSSTHILHGLCGLWLQHTEWDLWAGVVLVERRNIHGEGEMDGTHIYLSLFINFVCEQDNQLRKLCNRALVAWQN